MNPQQPIGPNFIPLQAPCWVIAPPQQIVYPYPPINYVYGQQQSFNHFYPPPPMQMPQPYHHFVPPHPHYVPQHAMHYYPPPVLPPYQQGPPIVNMHAPQQAPILMPRDPPLNNPDHGRKANIPDLPNNDVTSFTEHSQLESPSKNHVYMHGTLYNTELLKAVQSASDDSDVQLEDSDEEPYDPLDDVLPSIYGIRFYNPNYGPEGAIPKRPELIKKKINRKPKEAKTYSNNFPRYHSAKSFIPVNKKNLGDSVTYNRQFCAFDEGMARNKIRNQTIRLEAEAPQVEPKNAAHAYLAPVSPNLKDKKHRRQGRNRSRGYTQSFGIVAPGKRSVQSANENESAAKNVLSLFDQNNYYHAF